MRIRHHVIGLLAIASVPALTQAESSASFSPPGINRMVLVSETESITPGETFSVGLYIEPAEGFHTYWKHPGIVGVPTGIEWALPEGFRAGPIQWPAPILTKMAALTAYGYETEHLLVVDIAVPDSLPAETVTLSANTTWMACARSCHPGSHTFALTLPVNRSGQPAPPDEEWSAQFRQTRSTLPQPAPAEWELSVVSLAADRIRLALTIPAKVPGRNPEIHFFSYDNQVDSDEPQKIEARQDGSLTFTLSRPDFAPKKPDALAGVLYHPGGWPATDSKWIEISVPWTINNAKGGHE